MKEFDTNWYSRPIPPAEDASPVLRVVESDIDLYYHMALEMYIRVKENARSNKDSVFIVPVGPTFQYRRFVWLCRKMPIDLSGLHLFFMDEYLVENDRLIDPSGPLSFRGFIQRELLGPMKEVEGFRPEQVYFPDPRRTEDYDRRLEDLGGAEVCFAGVGINGHLAFNEPPEDGDPEFRNSPTRTLSLSRETITINSNTALGGAWEQIPARAVTVGMRQILSSRSLMIYLNRPWQRAVVRKLLYGPVGPHFPASYAQEHPSAVVTMTKEVAAPPDFGLR